jgi:molybdate-binding protein/DNA-binding XRE family transcriptional regulator
MADSLASLALNRVGELRRTRGWSQAELARRVGVSRAGIGAIESGAVVPSVATALRLAAALGSTVEELFGEPSRRWVGRPAAEGERVWVAGSRLLRVEPTAAGELAHDAVVAGGALERRGGPEEHRPSLVVAGCDPAVGLLGQALARRDVRLIPLQRASRAALEALAAGVADAAGVHLAGDNEAAVREVLGPGHLLVRVASWREGVVVAGPRPRALGPLVRGRQPWAVREPGSGARLVLERLFGQEGRPVPARRVVRDHRTVAELVREGWARAGVCVELVAAEAGLGFAPAETEAYDLVVAEDRVDEPAVRALLEVLRDRSFRALVGDLPGYDPHAMGEVRAIA